MKTNTPPETDTIKAGFGFDVSQDFARAKVDTPCTLSRDEYAKPGCVIAYIDADPKASLGFLKYGSNGKIRVHVQFRALASWRNEVTL